MASAGLRDVVRLLIHGILLPAMDAMFSGPASSLASPVKATLRP